MYEQIKNLIRQKSNKIAEDTLVYFTNYFYVLVKDSLIPKNVSLDDLIDNALFFAQKIEFYGENHFVSLAHGNDVKGLREPINKVIYIRDNLEEPLREITVYHELHHATQSNRKNNEVGINQESNVGRLVMEAETQYMAEKVYCEIHQIEFKERMIPSDKLRMLSNGTVISRLHNYEMYDNLLTKLAIIMGVSKDYFITINFLYNEGLKDLEQRYNIVKERYKLPYTFEDLFFILDYIYCVDLMAYTSNLEKESILEGKETQYVYEIHPKRGEKLSLKRQRELLNNFDVNNFLALVENNGPFREFAHYIIDNSKKELVDEMIKYCDLTSNLKK